MPPPSPTFRPRFDCLEARDTPAADLFAEAFDTVKTPALPTDWQSWVSTGDVPYITSKLTAVSGTNSLATLGTRFTASRFWNTTTVPADAGAAASLKTGHPAPISVIARGQNLGTASPSYLSAIVGSTGKLELVEVKNGVSKSLGSVTPQTAVFGPWVRVTLQPVGSTASVRLQRLDTGAFLNASGKWQAEPVDAIQKSVTWKPTNGTIGVGREVGGTGMGFIDNVTALAPPTVKESFDSTSPGTLPTGWVRWQNDGTAGFGVTGGAWLSPSRGLASEGGSRSESRAWMDGVLPPDVQASIAIQATTLIPASLVVRGSDLDTAKPTYYGLTLVRGLEVRLVKVVDGVETTLGTVKSKQYTSGQWVKLTLTANGDQLSAVVFRSDTGQWLSSDGVWQNWPDRAIEVTDGTITGEGSVGLVRSAKAAGTVVFDDLEVRPADAASGPQVVVTASQLGNVFIGDVTFRATSEPTGSAKRIEFRLDGKLKSATATGTGEWTLDTTLLTNGEHELIVRAIDGAGNVGSATFRFSVYNPNSTPAPVRTDLPQKLDHIRIAQLAYSGTVMDDFTKLKLSTSVDLIIPNPQYLQTIDTASPDTQQLVYTNLSNLYQTLLTEWLSYADDHDVSRELAFYHVSTATPWTGGSPSSQPVTWFWGVYRTPAAGGAPVDLTSAARGGRLFGVNFGGTGDAVAIGFPEQYREINVDLSKAAKSGWRGELEYASKVDANGQVIEWKALPVVTDGTGGLHQSGQITFDPPADWVAGTINGVGDRLFHVRMRTVSGTADLAPEARTILGRDYAQANGTINGVIPAFDYDADKNGDGYLNDAEYANRTSGFDARFIHETRLFYPYYGQMRYVTNPSSSSVRRWAAEHHTALLDSMPLADGLFLDNSNGRLPFAGMSVIEPVNSYGEDYANLTMAVWRAVGPKLVFTNTAGGWADATPVAGASTGVVEEFLLRPTEATWSQVNDVANLVASRLGADSPSPYVVLDTHPGSTSTNDPRTQIGSLAYYYLVADSERTMLMMFGGSGPAAAWKNTWIGAAEVDIGQAKGPMAVIAEGADPECPPLKYQVFSREYDNGLVLYKPRSYTLGSGTGSLSNATATTHQLNGSYRVVKADGSLGAVVTQVTLRNGEGAVLVKA